MQISVGEAPGAATAPQAVRAASQCNRLPHKENEMLANVLVALVAVLHAYFLVLEMFLWTRPYGLKTFGNTPEQAESTKVLAANQGLYNGFLAAGLVWGLNLGPEGLRIKVFFLACVVVAGLFGAMTVSRKIFFVQALPALLALAALWWWR
jgi:putative membrane protein